MLNKKMYNVVKNYLEEISSGKGEKTIDYIPTGNLVEFKEMILLEQAQLDISVDKIMKLLNSDFLGKYFYELTYENSQACFSIGNGILVSDFLYRVFFYQEYLRICRNKDVAIEFKYVDKYNILITNSFRDLDAKRINPAFLPQFNSLADSQKWSSSSNPYASTEYLKAQSWERGYKGFEPLLDDNHPEIYLLGHYTKIYKN